MAPDIIFTRGLGDFSFVPAEIRKNIYSLTLDFNGPGIGLINDLKRVPSLYRQSLEPIVPHRTALLRASRQIFEEARIVLYQTNHFSIWLDQDYGTNENYTIMGERGYKLSFGHTDICNRFGESALFNKTAMPWDMLPYLQRVHLNVGSRPGIREEEIVPWANQTLFGPERAGFISLLDNVHAACKILQGCHQLHRIAVLIVSMEDAPGSVELILQIIQKLRGVREVTIEVSADAAEEGFYWKLKPSYAKYMGQVMGLPAGAEVPPFVPDEDGADQDDDGIFEITRTYGSEDEEYEDSIDSMTEWDGYDDMQYEDWDEEYDAPENAAMIEEYSL